MSALIASTGMRWVSLALDPTYSNDL